MREYESYIKSVENKLECIRFARLNKRSNESRLVSGKIKLGDFRQLTRILFDSELPRFCCHCGSKKKLHIHHIKYKFPIHKDDLIRLCQPCHAKWHKRLREMKV